MFDFKKLNLKSAKKSGISFFAVFLAMLVAGALLKIEVGTPKQQIGDKIWPSIGVLAGGMVLNAVSDSGFLQDAGLGIAVLGSFKTIHSIKNKMEDKATLPEWADKLVAFVPQLSGSGSSRSGSLNSLGQIITNDPVYKGFTGLDEPLLRTPTTDQEWQ